MKLAKDKKRFKRYFVFALLVALLTAGFIGIWALLFGTFGLIEGKILLSTLVIGLYSILCLCCLTLVGKTFELVALAGVVSSSVSLLAFLWLIWFWLGDMYQQDVEAVWKLAYAFGVLGVTFAHQSLLLLLANRSSQMVKGLLRSAIIVISLVAAMLIYPVLTSFEDLSDTYWRLLGVLAILDVIWTIATPVLAKTVSKKTK